MRFLFVMLAAVLSASPAHAANWRRANDTDWVDIDTIVDRDGLTFAHWGQGAKDPAGGYTLPPTVRAPEQIAYKCSTAERFEQQATGAYATVKRDLNDPLFRLVCDAPVRRPPLAADQRQPLWTACNTNQPSPGAIEACSGFIEAAGEEPSTLSQVLVQRARLRYGNDKDGAIADLTRAIRFAPNTAAPYGIRGLFLYYGRHDTKKAIEDINKALSISPDSGNYFTRSVIYQEALYDFPRALADLDEAIKLSPRDWQSLKERCRVRAILNRDLDKAEADCRASLEIFPRWNSTIDALGLVNLKRGDLQAALENYDTAVKGDPDLMSPLYGRGITKLRLGRTSEGQADIAAALARDPKLAAVYERYGIKP